jgi:hypothetical protein
VSRTLKTDMPGPDRRVGLADVRGYINVRDLGNGESNASNIDFHLLP